MGGNELHRAKSVSASSKRAYDSVQELDTDMYNHFSQERMKVLLDRGIGCRLWVHGEKVVNSGGRYPDPTEGEVR